MRRSDPSPARAVAGIVLSALFLTACSVSADTGAARAAVTRFHEQLDAGQLDAIYDDAADELKSSATRAKFVALLEAVHRKLGAMRSSKERGWFASYRASGALITLTFATAFERGDATEQFVYRMHGSEARLAGYHINSDALILDQPGAVATRLSARAG